MSFFDKETKNVRYGGVPFIKLDVAENYVKLKKEICRLMDNKCIAELEDERLKIKAEKNIALCKQEKSSIVNFPVIVFFLSIICSYAVGNIGKSNDVLTSTSTGVVICNLTDIITAVITCIIIGALTCILICCISLAIVCYLVNRGCNIIETRRYVCVFYEYIEEVIDELINEKRNGEE